MEMIILELEFQEQLRTLCSIRCLKIRDFPKIFEGSRASCNYRNNDLV
jgi:hypothetical protein